MKLNINQKRRAYCLYNAINNFMIIKPDEYNRYGINKCEECNGTGLEGWKKINKIYKWNNSEDFCDKCQGVGFINFSKNWLKSYELFICDKCNGFGCSKCEYIGLVNWLSHARGE